MKLRGKIILTLLFVSVVPLFVVGYIETVSARRVLEKQFGQDGVEFGRQVVRNVYMYLRDVFQEVHGLSHSIPKEFFSEGVEHDQVENLISSFKKSGTKFYFICVLDSNGKVVASTYPEMKGEDFSDRAGFAKALGGDIDIQQPAYEKVVDNYAMMLSHPISELKNHDKCFSGDNEVLGVIAVALKWPRIQRIIRDVRIDGRKNDINNHLILIDDKGLVLSGPDPNMFFTANLVGREVPSAVAAANGENGYVVGKNEYGNDSLISYVNFRKHADIPDPGWSVLVVRDPKLVFASVDVIRNIMLCTIAVIVLVLIPVSLIFSDRLSRPVFALSQAAKAFGGGDLSRRVEVSRKDEIGTLGTSFNLMAEQVEEYSESLVSEVQERIKTEAALRESQEKYRGIIKNMDSGFAVHEMIRDDDGEAVDYRYLEVNDAYMKLAGVADPTGKRGRQVYPNLEQHWIDAYGEIARTGIAKSFELYRGDVDKWWHVYGYKVDRDQFACVFYDVTESKRGQEMLRIEVGELEALVQSRTSELEDANAELIVRMDELRQADEALYQSENVYRTLVENIELGIAMVDIDHNILFANSGQCKMFGKKPEELIGKKCYLQFEKREDVCGHCPGVLAMKTGKTEIVETEGVRENGEHFSVQLMASPLYDHDNNPRGFIEFVEDISERKHVESELHEYQERLRLLASKLTLSEEHERRRIAGGLHDSIIQPLVFLKMKLETLLNKPEDGKKLSASLIRMRDETAGLIAMTRGLTFDLSYPVLYEFGLEAAMEEWLREEIKDKHGLEIKFSDDGSDKPIDDDMRAFLFGAFRELLVNIIKHANAKKIDVAVLGEYDTITIRVKDDGAGFDCSKTRTVITKESGFGLFGIRDRLEYLGGNFKIESKIGSGTVVTLCAPLKRSV